MYSVSPGLLENAYGGRRVLIKISAKCDFFSDDLLVTSLRARSDPCRNRIVMVEVVCVVYNFFCETVNWNQ